MQGWNSYVPSSIMALLIMLTGSLFLKCLLVTQCCISALVALLICQLLVHFYEPSAMCNSTCLNPM
jgi:hypothetical protein